MRRAGLVSEQRLDRARNRFGSADYRAAEGVMRSVLVEAVGESYEAELAVLSCPVRLVWGEDDTEVPVSVARSAAAMLEAAGSTSPSRWFPVPATTCRQPTRRCSARLS